MGLVVGVAMAAVGVVGTAPAASAGDGYTLFGNESRRDLATYTIRLTNAALEPMRPHLQQAIDQIHAQTPTRLSIAPGIQAATGARGEIAVSAKTAGTSCGGLTAWDGCAGADGLSSEGGYTYIVHSYIWFQMPRITPDSTIQKQSLAAHELGHALGLAHHNDGAVLMHPDVTDADGGTYKAGDIRGLNYLARCSSNCGGGTTSPGQVWEAAGASSGWRSLPVSGPNGAVRASKGATVTRPDGTKLIYSLVNGLVWEAASNNAWTNLYTGISGASGIAATMRSDGTALVYTVRAGGQVWEAPSNSWRNLHTGISGASDIAVATRPNGTVMLYSLINGQVWEAPNSSWRNLNTGISGVSDISAAMRTDGLTLLYTVVNGYVWEAGGDTWRNQNTGQAGRAVATLPILGSSRVFYAVR